MSYHLKLFVCRMMEPQCFSLSVTPPKLCGPPPNLRNGFIQVSSDLFSHLSPIWSPPPEDKGKNRLLNSPLALFCSQNPDDYYQVGTMVEYSCVEGFYLSGDAVAECTEDRSWRRGPMVCQRMSSVVSLSLTFPMQTQKQNNLRYFLPSFFSF